jgi:uncharacterized membrane protein YkvA (DUF1232 family)
MKIWAAKKVHWRGWFEKKRQRAERLLEAPEVALSTADRAVAKAERIGKLSQSLTEIFTLGRLARAWARGEYRDVSRGTIVMVLGALVYFLSPIDAILDGIPVLGMIDDAMVLAWVVSEIRAELSDFRHWEQSSRALAAPPVGALTEAAPDAKPPQG